MELYEVVAHNSKHLDSALEDASKPCSPYGNSSTVEDVELIAKLKDALQKWKEYVLYLNLMCKIMMLGECCVDSQIPPLLILWIIL